MAHSMKCGGCGRETSCLFGAQFRNGDERVIVCAECWDSGKRCFFGENRLVVSDTAPEGYKEARLYWDEGCVITGGSIPICYPRTEQ